MARAHLQASPHQARLPTFPRATRSDDDRRQELDRAAYPLKHAIPLIMTSTLSRPNRLSKRNSSNNYNTSVTSVSTSSGPRRSGEDFEKALQAPDDVNRFSSADSKRFGIGNTASSTSTSYRDAASMTAVNNSGGLQPAVTRNSPDPQAESNSQGRPTHVSRLSISTATSSAASSGGGVGAPDSPRRSGHRGVHGHGKDKNGGTYAIGSVGVSVGIDCRGILNSQRYPELTRSFAI